MYNLQIAEISPGSSGGELTADWFEIRNDGDTAWVSGTDPDLYYEDSEVDVTRAALISGIEAIAPGERVVVILGDETDLARFIDVWNDVLDLTNVKIGLADGQGLGASGDTVRLFDNAAVTSEDQLDAATYTSNAAAGGATWDVETGAYNVADQNGAVATEQVGPDNQPAVGSPGNAPLVAQEFSLNVSEIWFGQSSGTDLTKDWFEITNTGVLPWTAGTDGALSYDDVSADPLIATPIEGLTSIASGARAIVVIGTEADATAFRAIWDDVYDLTGVQIGWTENGAGLGAGGDTVNLFIDGVIESSQAYTDGTNFSGRSWSVADQAFSAVGVPEGTLATTQTAGPGGTEGAIASPGDAQRAVNDYDLQITEIYAGQTGTEVTADWFEIGNYGTQSWTAAIDQPLSYDDDSNLAANASVIEGLTEIAAGERAIVVVGDAADAAAFRDVWDDVYDFSDVQVGYTDGPGLGAGGDEVTLFRGTLGNRTQIDVEGYPSTAANDGQSYDVELQAFSTVGNTNDAKATAVLGGTGATPSIASPGNASAAAENFSLAVTEIWAGQDGADLTADWFEIENVGNVVWSAQTVGGLFYDDVEVNGNGSTQATAIEGLSSIGLGERAIVVVGDEAAADAFRAVWDDVYDLSDVAIGWTDGAGLGAEGDAVRLFVEEDGARTLLDGEAYPDTTGFSGQSYDVELGAFSTVRNGSNAAETRQTAGTSGEEPAIASPGNLAPRIVGPDGAPEAAGVLETSILSRVTGLPGAEIVAFDPATDRAFVTSSLGIQIFDFSDPANPVEGPILSPIDLAGTDSDAVTSVAVSGGIIAMAVPGAVQTDPGTVVFVDAQTLAFLGQVQVGALPDMLTFTPDGMKVLVAIEASPLGSADPKGGVSIIDISGGFETPLEETFADFTSFDAQQGSLVEAGLRLFPADLANPTGEKLLLSDDVEPEYIAIAPDGLTAYVTLQEANAIAVLDIATGTFTEIRPLPAKDHSLVGNELDFNDQDGAIDLESAPVTGLLMPDGAASFTVGGQTYYITANEGDDRGENVRISTLDLDPAAFPNGIPAGLERLAVSSIDGLNADGTAYDELFAYGGRSFSIFDAATGDVVFDSGSDLERIIGSLTPELFNADESVAADFDSRSDAKGPEPESVTTGVIDGKTYAFVAIERAGGGVIVYDVTNPEAPTFEQYLRVDGDAAPEGLRFISAADSPNGAPLLMVSNEVSNTLTTYQLGETPVTPPPGGGGGGTPPVSTTPTAGPDLITGVPGQNNVISVGFGADTVNSGTGNDSVFGNQGNDQLFGNQGNDTVFGGQGEDSVYGGQGNDAVYGNLGNDIVYGNLGDDQVFGNEGDDHVFGNEGNDFVHGGQGNDSVYGGQGNDVLNGGQGNDLLQGGFGSDLFVFDSSQGADVITDFRFSEGDRIDLRGQDYVLGQNNEGQATLFLEGGGTVVLLGLTPDQFQFASIIA